MRVKFMHRPEFSVSETNKCLSDMASEARKQIWTKKPKFEFIVDDQVFANPDLTSLHEEPATVLSSISERDETSQSSSSNFEQRSESESEEDQPLPVKTYVSRVESSFEDDEEMVIESDL
jgi:hypothetical protein